MASTFTAIVYAEDMPEDSEGLRQAFSQTRVPNELLIHKDGEICREFFASVVNGRREAPGLALIDLSLPTLTGLELIRWIREEAGLKTIPLVALSREYNFSELEQSYDYGANLYLLKPRELREWADLVFRLQGYWSTQSTAT
jgi:CheY-like chemotaxis protein